MAQMTTKRLISEDQNPASDSGFGSAPNCILKCVPNEPEKNRYESPAATCALKCEPKGQLSSGWLFDPTNFPKIMKKFDEFLPYNLEIGQIKKDKWFFHYIHYFE